MSARKQSGSGVPPLSPEVGRVAPNAPWPVVRIGSALNLINGRAFKPSEWSGSGLPIVRIQNLNNPEAPFNFYDGELPAKFRLKDDDLLFAWSGTPGTSFGAHIWRGGDAWLNQHIFKVEFDENQFDRRFLRLAINQNLNDYIRAAHGGAGLAHITKGKFEASEIWCPPLPEQRRIVAEIETQWAKLDAGVAALKRVQANLKRYRAAVLQAACEGKLVPTEAELRRTEGRGPKTASIPREGAINRAVRDEGVVGSNLTGPTTFETGEQLLQRILAERRKSWTGRGKYKEPVAPDTSNLPALPEGWTWASVDALTGHITSGSRDWSQYYGKGTGTFVLAQNVRPLKLDMAERQTVDAPAGDAETERTRVVQNDLLVTIVGAKTGDVCRVPHELNDHFVCQSVGLLRPVSASTARYLELYLASPENGQAIWKRFIYGQGRPHLGFDELRATAVALPPLAEQTRIVAEVERRLSVIEELETLAATNLARATRLRQAVLKRNLNR
ncbi:MAG: restriction endonuclease subunit S [Opitutaceae bacterium]